MKPTKSAKLYCLFSALIGWFAIILQAYFIILNRTMPLLPALIKFFSYFTILTNLLVAICFTYLYFNKESRIKTWFSKAKTLKAINVYILVVGLIYNLVLRPLREAKGLEILADELLHAVVPLLFIIFWVFFVEKSRLKWKDAFAWLIYPFVYLIYSLIRGAIIKQYPYFFIDANKLNPMEILINCLMLFIVFLMLSWLFIGIGKLISKPTQT